MMFGGAKEVDSIEQIFHDKWKWRNSPSKN